MKKSELPIAVKNLEKRIEEIIPERIKLTGIKKGITSHFDHLVRNALTLASTLSQLIEREGQDPEVEHIVMAFHAIQDTNEYLDLIKRYPAFAQAELYGQEYKGEMAYPDLKKFNEEAVLKENNFRSYMQAYTTKSKQRLERPWGITHQTTFK